MKLHREGKTTIMLAFSVLVILIVGVSFLPAGNLVKTLLVVPFLVLFLLILWFFRIPERKINIRGNGVIAPADGKVVVIERVREDEYFKDERIQISIFMSPLNVHQNVYPVDGEVVYTKYHKGDYLVAWHPKSSTLNERSTIVLRSEKGTDILVRQIAGAVARRICTYSVIGEKVKQGQELGFIKFGSRVDIFLPLNAVIKTHLNQKSFNKITLLAGLP
jgi:phosphatidylserine decarboxylase